MTLTVAMILFWIGIVGSAVAFLTKRDRLQIVFVSFLMWSIILVFFYGVSSNGS